MIIEQRESEITWSRWIQFPLGVVGLGVAVGLVLATLWENDRQQNSCLERAA